MKETSRGNTPSHPTQRTRQRRNQQFEGLEEYDYQVDRQTGWRTYPSKSTRHVSPCASRYTEHQHKFFLTCLSCVDVVFFFEPGPVVHASILTTVKIHGKMVLLRNSTPPQILHMILNHFFNNVTSEHNSTFVFLKLWLQLRILEMTEIHQ